MKKPAPKLLRRLFRGTRGLPLLILFLVLSACVNGGGNNQRTAPPANDAPAGNPASPSRDPGETPGSQGQVIQINVRSGRVTPRVGSAEVRLGQPVRIEVTSDAADEVHVHVYDRRADLRPGETAVLEFDADIPGSFEVELEKTHLELFELQVR